MPAPETDPLVFAPDLARTYNHPSYADAWDCVKDYFEYLDYTARNPEHGRGRIASALEIPEGRVRSWNDGSLPDCVHAIQNAEELGWVNTDYSDRSFRALSVLVAWIFSGGSISRETFSPYFAFDNDEGREVLERAADAAGIELRSTRSDQSGHGQELRPVEHESLLGRVLSVLGAPVGEKAVDHGLSLPDYLDASPSRIRQEFVQVYLVNRAQSFPDKTTLRLREERGQTYLKSLANLIADTTGERSWVDADKNITISAPAAREIESWPPILSASRPGTS